MSAAAATESEAPAAPAAAPAKRKLLPMIVIAVVMAAAGGGAWFFFAGNKSAPAAGHDAAGGEHGGEHGAATEEGHEGEAAKGAAVYLPLQPAFVVNLEDVEAARYLQVEMELMARDQAALDIAKTHMPRVRNALLLLLGSRHAADLASRAGKEKLQADVVAEVQKVLTEVSGKPQIEAVYFNSFVMQ